MVSMDGASFSSFRMSQQREFLILGAREEAEEGQTVTPFPNHEAHPANFKFKTLISNSKSLPVFQGRARVNFKFKW